MTEKNEAIVLLEQFTEHCNAFRQTLPEDERELLDKVIANAAFEVDVEAHVLSVFAAEGRTASRTFKEDPSSILAAGLGELGAKSGPDDEEDVQAHGLTATEGRTQYKLAFGDQSGYMLTAEGGII